MSKTFLTTVRLLVLSLTLLLALGISAYADEGHSCEALGENVVVQPLSQDGGELATGDYYLAGDITITQEFVISAGQKVNICLNGYNISCENCRAFTIEPTAELKIDSCSIYWSNNIKNTIQNGKADQGGGILNKGTLYMNCVHVCQCSSTGNGGGVYCAKGSVFNGGEVDIRHNQAGGDGGGIYCGKDSTINIEGWLQIYYCTANGDGGGIYTSEGCNCSMGESSGFVDNQATGRGGAMYGDGKSIKIDDAVISFNSANVGGGAYICAETCELEAYIIQNKANSVGGMMIVSGETTLMEYAKVKENTLMDETTPSNLVLADGATVKLGASFKGKELWLSPPVSVNQGQIVDCTDGQTKDVGNVNGILFVQDTGALDVGNLILESDNDDWGFFYERTQTDAGASLYYLKNGYSVYKPVYNPPSSAEEGCEGSLIQNPTQMTMLFAGFGLVILAGIAVIIVAKKKKGK